MKDDNKIDLRLASFGEAVRSAAGKQHKLKPQQKDFFKNAIRDESKKDQGASNVVHLNFSKDKANTKQQDQSQADKKQQDQSNQNSKGHGHSH